MGYSPLGCKEFDTKQRHFALNSDNNYSTYGDAREKRLLPSVNIHIYIYIYIYIYTRKRLLASTSLNFKKYYKKEPVLLRLLT